MIETMREDFPWAAKGEAWDAAEQAEIGAAVRDAIAAGDEEALAYWAGRIRVAAEAWRAWCARVRLAEARIREEMSARRRGDGPAAV